MEEKKEKKEKKKKNGKSPESKKVLTADNAKVARDEGGKRLILSAAEHAAVLQADLEQKRRKALLRHKTHVQQSCELLGEQLISKDEKDLGHRLIANGWVHDNSKFHGIEWLYLYDDVKEISPEMFKLAVIQHRLGNLHHPEYWNGIANMPRLYLAEFVCDIHARASEFGTDVRDWVKSEAAKKFDFTVQSRVYKDVKYFLDLLLASPF